MHSIDYVESACCSQELPEKSHMRRYGAICCYNDKNLLAGRALKLRFIRILSVICLKMYTTIMCALFHMNKKNN